jgi:O-antigen ligase
MTESGSSEERRRTASNSRRQSKRRSAGRSTSRKANKEAPMTSSFGSAPLPSRASIRPLPQKVEKAAWLGYLFGLLGVVGLILLGGSDHPFAMGFALALPGLALIVRPPQSGMGKLVDYSAIGFFACVLFALLPAFYWPSPEWRTEAVDSLGIALPAVLSVQPWISFEAIMMALAGFAWFYLAANWKVNGPGRKLFFASLCTIFGILAATVIWGDLYGVHYPGTGDARVFTFFPDSNQTANVLAIAGVVGFAFAVEGLKGRKVIHLLGVVSTALCLVALTMSASRFGLLLYLFGISIWFVVRLRAKSVPTLFKVGFPILLIAFSLAVTKESEVVERVNELLPPSADWEQTHRSLIYKDSINMILDAPLLGHGVGTFAAVFPQYREDSRHFEAAYHPESDVLWVISEVGIVGFAFLVVCLAGYFRRCRGLSRGRGGAFRVIAMVGVVIFLVHALLDVPGHRPGTVYFAILFAALALPSAPARASLKPAVWRVAGLLLLSVGGLWMVSGLTLAPFYSTTAIRYHERSALKDAEAADYYSAIERVGKSLEWNPLSWHGYFHRAELELASSGDLSKVAADFEVARFVEPTLGAFCVKEGFVWLPHDRSRAIAAWRVALSREIENKEQAYQSMLSAGLENPELMEAVVGLFETDRHYRTIAFSYLEGALFRATLRDELTRDPALRHFSRAQRTSIVSDWIRNGDLDGAEAFLAEHRSDLEDGWWLSSLLMKERADFDAAIRFVREGLAVPKLPEVDLSDALLTRMSREFAVMPEDVVKGTALLSAFWQKSDFVRALQVADALLESPRSPAYVHYWRGEILYQMDDVIESWYAFSEYVTLVNEDLHVEGSGGTSSD